MEKDVLNVILYWGVGMHGTNNNTDCLKPKCKCGAGRITAQNTIHDGTVSDI